MVTTTACNACLKSLKGNCRSLNCFSCSLWYHLNCTTLSFKDYKYYSVSDNGWLCFQCRSDVFPFFAFDSHALAELAYNSNTSCLCSRNTVNNKLDPCHDLILCLPFLNIPTYIELIVIYTCL